VLPDFAVRLDFVAFPVFFGVAAFFALADSCWPSLFFCCRFPFWLSFLARSSLLSFVLSASDDTFITPVRKECEAKDGKYRSAKKGLDERAGNEVGVIAIAGPST